MSVYEEVEFEDLEYDPVKRLYTYPCPCGDHFRISLEDLWDGEDIAPCPSCTLRIRIIYEEEDLPPLPDDTDEDSSGEEETEESDDINVDPEKEDSHEHLQDVVDSVQRSLKVQ